MTAEFLPTRQGLVEGRDVFVFDGLVPDSDLAQYVAALDRAPFTRTEFAQHKTGEYKHWISEIPVANVTQLPVWGAIERTVAYARPGEDYRPYRAYTNYAAYGDMLFTHTDARPDARELTALLFFSTEWDPEWGGETMFFDSSGDAMFCASPKPGRLVLFDGAIAHVGRPPSRICYTPRYTFAIKLTADAPRATEANKA